MFGNLLATTCILILEAQMNIICERLRSKFTTAENLKLQIIIIALTSVRIITERSGWYQNVEKITGYKFVLTIEAQNNIFANARGQS